MGHEAIIYGRIIGASWHAGERFGWLHDLNGEAVGTVPEDDDWPWVVRGIFALPAPYPQGLYRRQVIHFGLSLKDDPVDIKFGMCGWASLRRFYGGCIGFQRWLISKQNLGRRGFSSGCLPSWR